jgi:DNA-directed RNA polymerase specialized sigma24 family protein
MSFEVFFESERVRLHRGLFAITGSRQEAEDISQEAFLRVWERWDRVGVLDEPVGYLHRTAMNVFRDRRRRLVASIPSTHRVSAILIPRECQFPPPNNSLEPTLTARENGDSNAH